MASTIATRDQSVPVRSLDNIRPTPAKAVLPSDQIGLVIGEVIKDAVVKHYGSVKAAAISLEVDPSLMVREFEAGKIARLERADDIVKAAVATALFNAYGLLEDPKDRAARLVREARQRLDELDEYLRFIA